MLLAELEVVVRGVLRSAVGVRDHPGHCACSGGDSHGERVEYEFPSVPSITPIERATSAMLRPSSRTIATASRWNYNGYFDGRPVLFLLDMDILLYEVSAQRGDAQDPELPRRQHDGQQPPG